MTDYPIEVIPRAIYNSTLTASNKVPLGDMEDEGVAGWTVGNSAVLTKQHPAYQGFRCLRVEHGGTNNPYASLPAVVTIGKDYRITGRARGNPSFSGVPLIGNGVGNYWSGTASTAWQNINVVVTATAVDIWLNTTVTTAGLYCEFDAIRVQEVDADGAYVDPYYYLTGWAQGDGVAAPIIYDGGTVIWTGTASTSWQQFKILFLPLTTKIHLGSDFPLVAVGYDDVSLRQVPSLEESLPTNPLTPFAGRVIQTDIDTSGNVSMFENGVSLAGPGSVTVRKLNGAGWVGADLTGCDFDHIANYFEGNIGELLVYARNLTTDERVALTTFLKTKWGIA